LTIIAYIISVASVVFTIYFFKNWQSGKFLTVVVWSYLIRFLLFPVFEIYGIKIMPEEISELLEWYKIWIDYGEVKSNFYILINPFDYEGSKGMYLYYTMYAGWFLNLTNFSDMIPLRIFTSSISLYVIVISVKLAKLIYQTTISSKQVFIIVNWPFWLYYSVTLGRTIPSVLIPLIGIIATYKLLEKISLKYIVIVAITFWLTFIFRTFYVFFFVSTILSFFTYKIFFEGNWKSKIYEKIIFATFTLLVILLVTNIISFENIFKLMTVELASGDQVDGNRTGSSYLLDYFPEKISDLWLYLPIHGIYFFLSPMIWDVYKIDQLVSCTVALISMGLIIKMMINSTNNKYGSSPKAKIFMLNMLIVCLMLGAGVKNAGAAQRWRLPVTVIVLCVSLVGNRPKTGKNKNS
jgi:hypothetical protein